MTMEFSVPAYWRVKSHLYKLEAARCKSCGKTHYPPMAACPHCGSRDLEKIRLPERGVLESYTIVYSIPEGARSRAPVIVGLVRLGDVRVIAELTDVSPNELREGVEVEAVLRRISEDREAGIIRYAVKFRPVLRVQS